MKTKSILCLITLPSLLGGITQAASLGAAFTYQGRLIDAGTPATALYDLRFALYDSASGGSQVGLTLTNSAVGVTNGLFTVSLDFGAAVFDGNSRWLEIGERPNGTGAFATLTPRQPLTPSPYALYAPGAGTAITATTAATATAVAPGSVGTAGLAGNSITSSKLASDSGSLAKVSGGAMTSSGTSFTLATNGYLADHDFFLRNDALHGLGWYGNPKYFAGVNVNGPVLYGNGGGALGARGATTNIALQWDGSRNVTMPGALNVSGTVTAASFSGSGSGLTGITVGSSSITAAKLANDSGSLTKVTGGAMKMNLGALFLDTDAYLENDTDLYLRNDFYDGLGWYGDTKPFAGVNGPVLYGHSGGALGTAYGTPRATLRWGSSSVDINGSLGVTNSIFADSLGLNTGTLNPGLVFGSSGSGEGLASKRTSGGNQNGLDFYTGYQARLSIANGGDTTINGNVTINTSDAGGPGYGDLRVNGYLRLTALKNWTSGTYPVRWDPVTYLFHQDSSSRRYKENIRPLDADFDALLQVQPMTYTRPGRPDDWEIGFIAEDLDALGLRPLVLYDPAGRPDAVDYDRVCLYLLQIAKEQRSELERQANRVEALEQTVAELKALVGSLAAKVNGAGQ